MFALAIQTFGPEIARTLTTLATVAASKTECPACQPTLTCGEVPPCPACTCLGQRRLPSIQRCPEVPSQWFGAILGFILGLLVAVLILKVYSNLPVVVAVSFHFQL